jgi:phosphoribosylaminoimidazole-succinocarboxamide synthase
MNAGTETCRFRTAHHEELNVRVAFQSRGRVIEFPQPGRIKSVHRFARKTEPECRNAPFDTDSQMGGLVKHVEMVANLDRGINPNKYPVKRQYPIRMTDPIVLNTNVAEYPCRRGKVRDVYDLGNSLVIVASDRISAFDWIMPNGIPGKGRVLTEMTLFWLKFLAVPNHLISASVADLPQSFRDQEQVFAGRTMLVRKTEVIPVECVARGYLAGSGWKEYRTSRTVCGIALPAGLQEASALPQPIFTPATKAEQGLHDENIAFDRMCETVGRDTAAEVRDRTLDVYRRGAAHAASRGIILADTKLEWGRLPSGELILIDEVLTPDSSRYWPKQTYRPGASPPSFDKQFVRDWLETTGWDKASEPPRLPDDVVDRTAEKYQEALAKLTS